MSTRITGTRYIDTTPANDNTLIGSLHDLAAIIKGMLR